MFDIKLYLNTGNYLDYKRTIEHVSSAPVDGEKVPYLETLANKVVKYLLTTLGTDVMHPQYGAYTAGMMQFSNSYLPKYVFEFSSDVRRCMDYIRATETPGPDGERLANIKVVRVDYNQDNNPAEIHRVIEIITSLGNRALLTMPVKNSKLNWARKK